ncbi:MAG: lipoprotein-releasing ABC transporter ATP-binding protein LolD [Pseudomonadota bacterium]|nr:lipoprotein-releasing ABC transporter ATP-binding protein LolD [Pseudomonadota bacterium]
MNDKTLLEAKGLRRIFSEGNSQLVVLNDLNLSISRGERLAIVGESGSGKTTLLQLLGGLDSPSSGSIVINGQNFVDLSDSEKGVLRNRTLGFVYQFHHLLPEFTALENVAMPLLLRRLPTKEARDEAKNLLHLVGLSDRMQHRPGELSGGERQRTAVARALVTKPSIVLADEPTGNLDHRSGESIFELMLELNRKLDSSLVIVTHDLNLAKRMDRVLELSDGLLTEKFL